MTTTSSDQTPPIDQSADFESTRIFTAAPDAVFDALTTPAGITEWWTPVSGSGLEGGELRFVFPNLELLARVDRADRPTAVRWVVLECGMEDWVGTAISFDLAPTATGGTRLDFRHIGLTPQLECFEQCSAGWTFYLPSLVDYVDTGVGRPNQRHSASADTAATR
jgi:uncharacterized protein YndB with AHSA1/START domain